ncbi:MAG TPA: transposase, partial [Bacillota bacterium]|nr:transposase [Bacillota bacterium]
MDRTVRLKLLPETDQAAALSATASQFTAAFNSVCRTGWDANEKNGVRLHHLTYREAKAECPALVSDLLIQARVKAT